MNEEIENWTIKLRRGKPCVEGTRRSDGAMIHVYISFYNVVTGGVVCAETAKRYYLKYSELL